MIEEGYTAKICILCYPDELLTPWLRSYADGVMEPSRRSPLGIDILTKQFKIDATPIKLVLVDISTKPSDSLRPSYYRRASAAVFAFSKSDPSFVESAIGHFHEFRHHIPDPTVPVAFVGLHDESESVTLAEGQSLVQELGADYYEMAVDDLQSLDTILKSLSQKILSMKGESV